MTLIEKKSKRKATAIRNLVDSKEYSLNYALIMAEELNDSGKLLDTDYEQLVEYLENLLNKELKIQEETFNVEEHKTLSDEPLF